MCVYLGAEGRGRPSRPAGRPEASKAPPRACPGLAKAHEPPPRPPRPAPSSARASQPQAVARPGSRPRHAADPRLPSAAGAALPTCRPGEGEPHRARRSSRTGGSRYDAAAPVLNPGSGACAGAGRRGAVPPGSRPVPSRPCRPRAGLGPVPRGGRGAGRPAVPLATGRRVGGGCCGPVGPRRTCPPGRRKARSPG